MPLLPTSQAVPTDPELGLTNDHGVEATRFPPRDVQTQVVGHQAPARPRMDSDITLQNEKQAHSGAIQPTKNIVDWDGPNDLENPRNWSAKRKWMATYTVAMFSFISPIASSMIAPALTDVAQDLNVPQGFQTSLLLSIFVLAYAFGPLLIAPLSEIFGRTKILQSSFMLFLVFCLACGFAQNKAQFYTFRIISGLGGSAPLAIGAGTLADLWAPEQRGRALGLYVLMPLLGPALGPIFGGFIAEYTTWRWIFWSTAAYTGLIQVIGFFALRETYAPVLLARKAARIRKENGDVAQLDPPTEPEALGKKLVKALKRPTFFLFTQPIIQALTLFQLYQYGTLYLIYTTFPDVWTDVYHEAPSIGGLNYLSIGLGFAFASVIVAPLNDKIYIHLKNTRGHGQGKPEYRIPLMFPGSVFVVGGLFIYGWAVELKVHWIVPNIGMFLLSIGVIVGYQCAQTYNIDSYSSHAASGVAAVVMLRSVAGFAFPLFAPAMYDTLGWGWGNSLLGFIALGIGTTAPLGFWFFGERLRQRSSHARSE